MEHYFNVIKISYHYSDLSNKFDEIVNISTMYIMMHS